MVRLDRPEPGWTCFNLKRTTVKADTGLDALRLYTNLLGMQATTLTASTSGTGRGLRAGQTSESFADDLKQLFDWCASILRHQCHNARSFQFSIDKLGCGLLVLSLIWAKCRHRRRFALGVLAGCRCSDARRSASSMVSRGSYAPTMSTTSRRYHQLSNSSTGGCISPDQGDHLQ